jgi:predicted transcriptional regulator
MERLCDLLFEVSNEVRLTILQNLEEGPSNISKLSKELDISNQECRRHVSRLMDAELAGRDSEGQYGLTEYGGLISSSSRCNSNTIQSIRHALSP